MQLPPTWPYALHLLAHLYHGNLEDARLLWMQIPDSAKQVGSLGGPCMILRAQRRFPLPKNVSRQEPEVQACHALLQRLWRRDFQVRSSS